MSPVTIELRKGRKRRPSNSLEDGDDPVMDDCMAAMVLMSLSCSPKSTFIPDRGKKNSKFFEKREKKAQFNFSIITIQIH